VVEVVEMEVTMGAILSWEATQGKLVVDYGSKPQRH